MSDSVIKRFIGYFAVITLSEGYYCVEFPDIVGCMTQGESLEEALCNGRKALTIHYLEKKGDLPNASSYETIRKQYPEAIVQMIALDSNDVKPLRTVNKTLTIPEWLNRLAEKYHVNFSQVLRNALISYLKGLDNISNFDRKLLID